MIEYPLDIEAFESDEDYDPFLSHVIRHKLRKKKNRRKLRRLLRNHPKNRILRSLGIGRRSRKSGPIRSVSSRYRRPDSRPLRNTMRRNPRRMLQPVAFGNPMHRDIEKNSRASTMEKGIPRRKGKAVMFGDPSKRNQSPIQTVQAVGNTAQGSKDIVLPYKRRYGKVRPKPMAIATTNKSTSRMEENIPISAQVSETTISRNMKEKEENQVPAIANNKRKMKNIIGIAVVGLLVTGFVMYTMKSKIKAHGHTR